MKLGVRLRISQMHNKYTTNSSTFPSLQQCLSSLVFNYHFDVFVNLDLNFVNHKITSDRFNLFCMYQLITCTCNCGIAIFVGSPSDLEPG